MIRYSMSPVIIAAIVVVNILLGALVAVAAVPDSFKLKENKMFFNVVEGGNVVVLPSTVGRNGHTYMYVTAGSDIALETTPGDTINLGPTSTTDLGCGGGMRQLIMVADEVNQTWWSLSCDSSQ